MILRSTRHELRIVHEGIYVGKVVKDLSGWSYCLSGKKKVSGFATRAATTKALREVFGETLEITTKAAPLNDQAFLVNAGWGFKDETEVRAFLKESALRYIKNPAFNLKRAVDLAERSRAGFKVAA